MRFHIHQDIRQAETLPAIFYTDSAIFEASKEAIFRKAWHFIGDTSLVRFPGDIFPFSLLPGLLQEPMLLTHPSDKEWHCLSNVCTHRGMLLAQNPAKVTSLRCAYHGRKFSLSGAFESMPEFEEALHFPRLCEDLQRFPLQKWGPLFFAGLEPEVDIQSFIAVLQEKIGFWELDRLRFAPERSKEYLVQAHWALYCENYLEGFHIPFVHAGLNRVLDYGAYETVLYPHFNLQVGYADGPNEVFDLPKDHVDAGKEVAAYYFWLFPNLMLNFYPWGLSVNVVKPIHPTKTHVAFLTYIYDETKLDSGAGADLDKVEREDEAIVEAVQKGLQSHYYPKGRFSPTREKGVHQFQKLLASFIGDRT